MLSYGEDFDKRGLTFAMFDDFCCGNCKWLLHNLRSGDFYGCNYASYNLYVLKNQVCTKYFKPRKK